MDSVFPDSRLSREPYLNAVRAAAHLSISPKKLLAMARAGLVPAYGIGQGKRKMWRFLLPELDHWMQTTVTSGSDQGRFQGRRTLR